MITDFNFENPVLTKDTSMYQSLMGNLISRFATDYLRNFV